MTRHNPWLHRRPLLFAHQGGAREGPANTLAAFKAAVAAGAHALELDVHATADGHIVVSHDPTVDHATDGTGAIAALTLEEVQQLDAAHWFVPGEGTVHGRAAEDYPLRGVVTGVRAAPHGLVPDDFRIPTLAEVLAALPQTLVNIDIKATHPDTAPYETALAALLAAHGRGDDTMVASFLDAALAAFGQTGSAVSTSATPTEVAAFWSAVHAGGEAPDLAHRAALQVPQTFGDLTVVTPEVVAAAHEAGLAVHVWTIDDVATAEALLALGVDGIVSDRPAALAPLFRTG